VQRELAEEAVTEADRLVKLCAYHTSRASSTRPPTLTSPKGCAGRASGRSNEFIEVRAFPFDEVIRMVERTRSKDSMTIVAVLHAARRRGR